MSLARIGPVEVEHGDPSFGWQGGSDGAGVRSASIEGLCTWSQAQRLSEMVANPDRRMTVAGRSGALEYVHFDDDMLGDFCGWYLLERANLTPSQPDSMSAFTAPFSIAAAFLGDGVEVVVVHSSRTLPNGHGFIGTPAAYDPFPGGEFVLDPSIAGTVREADELVPHDVARDSEPLT